jgi:hypothetical protein
MVSLLILSWFGRVRSRRRLASGSAGFRGSGGVDSIGTAMLKVAKVLGNNYALVLLLVLVGALFWPNKQIETRGPIPTA